MTKQSTKSESISIAGQSSAAEGRPAEKLSMSTENKVDATVLLSADHRKVEQLFQQYSTKKSEQNTTEKQQLIKQICTELNVHTQLEEELFYPACREKGVKDDMLDEAQVEHDSAKLLITELMSGSVGDEYLDAKVKVLQEYIELHVKEEEKDTDGIFAKARQAGVDMKSVGEQIQSRKPELLKEMEAGNAELPQTPSFNRQQQQENRMMNRHSNERERNSRGQFVSDDRNEDRYRSYSQNDEGWGNNRGWQGNTEGHPRASEESWERRGSGSHGAGYSSRNDRDEYGNGGRSRFSGENRGWQGNPENHSSASEEGWEHRGGSRGGYSSRNEYEDRGSSGGRGWFGDSDNHSRASEEGWENRSGGSRGGYSSRSDRDENDYGDNRRSSRSSSSGEGRNWQSDPESHSRSSEEHRRGGGGYSSRSDRDEYSGRSSRSSSGEGRGWHGDSEGHSRASEEGWEHRRG